MLKYADACTHVPLELVITQVLVIAKGAELCVLLTSWFWLFVAFNLLMSTYLSYWCIIGIVSVYQTQHHCNANWKASAV